MAQKTQFPPLEEVTKPMLTTAEYCHYSNFAKQTAWLHACKENGPVRAVRIGGRLGWSTKAVKQMLGVAA
ncbi:hypothetical protein [Malikia spinosa]|uniref:hypothetical protein n=1 Tax=Malikia spinosa TaxID=86180 RepID=UPI0027B9679D|nr:hypothetical protein [Malikia spinosa]